MEAVALSGRDSIKLGQLAQRILNDLADADAAVLTFPNDIMNVKVGKNGNALFAANESGKMAEVVLRVVRGTDDDKYLNNLFASQQNNPEGFILMAGEFVKRVGDGKGNITNDTYITSGGVFFKGVEAKSNAEGDTEQSVSMYHIRFSKAVRVIT